MNIYRNRFTLYLVWRFFLRLPRFRMFLTNAFVPNDDIDIPLFGSKLRINRRKEIGYYRAFRQSTGNIVFRDEVAPLLSLALLIERGDTFVDVGANVGLYSAILNRVSAIFPENYWYAFEANPDTAQRLIETLSGQNVRIVNAALSNRITDLEFVGGATSGVFGPKQSASDFQFGASTLVRTLTLDSAQILGDSIIMKVDVEGHEREVLEGAMGLFQAGRVKAVYVDGFSDRSLPDWLRGRGMKILDGKTLGENVPSHSLLGVNQKLLDSGSS